jgi:hypothetical protein
MQRTIFLSLGLVVALLLGSGSAVATRGSRGPAGEWTPPGNTIVRVTGDAGNGFGIFYYDGTSAYPPTDSEALAECSEYSTYVERERCKTQVRQWYRDLAATKRAINWARYSAVRS